MPKHLCLSESSYLGYGAFFAGNWENFLHRFALSWPWWSIWRPPKRIALSVFPSLVRVCQNLADGTLPCPQSTWPDHHALMLPPSQFQHGISSPLSAHGTHLLALCSLISVHQTPEVFLAWQWPLLPDIMMLSVLQSCWTSLCLLWWHPPPHWIPPSGGYSPMAMWHTPPGEHHQ